MFKQAEPSRGLDFLRSPKRVKTCLYNDRRIKSRKCKDKESAVEDLDLSVDEVLVDAEVQTERTHTVSAGLTAFYCMTVNGVSSTQVSHREKTPIYVERVIMEKPYMKKDLVIAECSKLKLSKTVACGPDRRVCAFYGYDSVRDRETGLRDLTALSSSNFDILLDIIIHNESRRAKNLTIEDQLLCFLMKLKLGLSYSALSVIFGTSSSSVSRLFLSALDVLSVYSPEKIYWPSRKMVQATSPAHFRENWPAVRVLFDCTEVQTIKPGNTKNFFDANHTVKYLLGVTPAGFISFLSKGYDGTRCERFIVSDCGILQQLEAGDCVVADGRFAYVEPVIKEKGATLMLSTFGNSCVAAAKVPNAKIHVGRVVHRIKVFNILKTKIPVTLLPHIDKIVHVCAFLANLTAPDVSDKAGDDSEDSE